MITAAKAKLLTEESERQELSIYFEEISEKITEAAKNKRYFTYWSYTDTAPIGDLISSLASLGYKAVRQTDVDEFGLHLSLYISWV